MEAIKMNKSKIIINVALAFISFSLFFTGCTNSLSQKNNGNKDNSAYVCVSGNISVPSAVPSRMATTSWTKACDLNNQGNVRYFIIATPSSGGTPVEVEPVDGRFLMYVPNEDEEWTFVAQCLTMKSLVYMESAPQVKQVSKDDTNIELDPFVLDFISDFETTYTGYSRINIPFGIAEGSDIQKLHIVLNQKDVPSPASFTYNIGTTDPDDICLTTDANLPPGLYDVLISFIDSNDYIYGPVVETFSLMHGFITDAWYGLDSFIKTSTDYWGDPVNMFIIPTVPELQTLFPNYHYANAITSSENVAVTWDYVLNKYEANCNFYKVENGNIGDSKYPVFKNLPISDVCVDYETNDIYGFMNGDKIVKFTASSGYSEYIENTVPCSDTPKVAFTASNGVCYMFGDKSNTGSYLTNHFYIYKFNDTGNEPIYVDELPLHDSNYFYESDFVRITLCGDYLFMVAKKYDDQYIYENAFFCEAYKIQDNTITSVWEDCFRVNKTDLNPYNNFSLKDIVAVSNGTGTPDLYVLINRIYFNMSISNSASSYGGIVKISTKTQESNLVPELDSDYGIRGLYVPQTIPDNYKSTPEAEADSHFYNPVKFVGKKGNNFLVADAGLVFTLGTDDKGVTCLEDVDFKSRIVSVNLTAANFTGFGMIKDVDDCFDYILLEKNQNLVLQDCYSIYRLSSSSSSGYYYNNETSQISVNPDMQIMLIDRQGNDTTTLPAKKEEKLFVVTENILRNAEYDIKILSNGVEMNSLTDKSDPYYSVDTEKGEITLNKALPVIGYNYVVSVNITNTLSLPDGTATVLHYDTNIEVTPVTEFEIPNQNSAAELNALLDSYLISDRAVIQVSVTKSSTLPISDFVEILHSYLQSLNIPDLTLDYSVAQLQTVEAGMFGINCKKIILPQKHSKTSNCAVDIIKKDAFTKDGVNFTGDLVIHKSIQNIEDRAFAVPPRSITIDTVGWVTSTDSGDGKFFMKDITSTGSGKYMLTEKNSNVTFRVIACTKRNELFSMDFSSWSITQIDSNAFRGLPVTDVNLGNVAVVGQGAFENTLVSTVYTGSSLEKIGYKALPANAVLTFNGTFPPNDYKWFYSGYKDQSQYEEFWNQTETIQVSDSMRIDDPQNIITRINEQKGIIFAFKKAF